MCTIFLFYHEVMFITFLEISYIGDVMIAW